MALVCCHLFVITLIVVATRARYAPIFLLLDARVWRAVFISFVALKALRKCPSVKSVTLLAAAAVASAASVW